MWIVDLKSTGEMIIYEGKQSMSQSIVPVTTLSCTIHILIHFSACLAYFF